MTWSGPRKGDKRRAYEVVRKRVLERDGHRCQIGLPGVCEGRANAVDHIRPIVEGGAALDESNLRAACRKCNSTLGGSTSIRRVNARTRRWSRSW